TSIIRDRSRSNVARSTSNSSVSSPDRAVAARGASRTSPISPKDCPRPSVARIRSFPVVGSSSTTFTLPRRTTKKASAASPVPQARDQTSEDGLPVVVRRVEGEDGEHGSQHRIQREPPLLLGQPLAQPDLVGQVVLHETERLGPEVRHLDEVREQPVPVQLQK